MAVKGPAFRLSCARRLHSEQAHRPLWLIKGTYKQTHTEPQTIGKIIVLSLEGMPRYGRALSHTLTVGSRVSPPVIVDERSQEFGKKESQVVNCSPTSTCLTGSICTRFGWPPRVLYRFAGETLGRGALLGSPGQCGTAIGSFNRINAARAATSALTSLASGDTVGA